MKMVAAAVVVLGIGAAPPKAAPETSPVVRLAWRDLADLPVALGRAARAEVENLYAAAGVNVAWAEAGTAALPIYVMRAEARELRLAPDVMGLSRPHGDAAWIAYGTLLRTLGLRRQEAHRGHRLAGVGRALGRVAAHEVVHVLARPHVHADRGLMRARLGGEALMAAGIDWDEATRRAFVDGLRAAGERAPSAPAAVTGDPQEAPAQ